MATDYFGQKSDNFAPEIFSASAIALDREFP
jgi:hypothetical protein